MKTLKYLLACFVVLGLVSMLIAFPALRLGKAPEKGKAAIAAANIGPVLERILQRSEINIGVSYEDIPGFIEHVGNEELAPVEGGIEYDYGLALAAAISCGRGTVKINWVQLEDYDLRFTKLKDGTLDVVLDVCTYNNVRDVNLTDVTLGTGFQFPAIYFYDGTNVVLKAPPGATVNVAVGQEVSNYPQLVAYLAAHPELSGWNVVAYPSDADAEDAFHTDSNIHGYCSDASYLKGVIITERDANTPGAEDWYVHFSPDIAKSPLASVVAEGDTNWEEIVKWVSFVLLTAEEEEYGFNAINGFPHPKWGPTVPGLNDGWASSVIKKVGSYKDIWDRNFIEPYGDVFEPRGANRLWEHGGVHYSAPWD